MEEAKKIHFNDVQVIKGKDTKDYFKVEGGTWSLNERFVREQACTHMTCKTCEVEMVKHYTMVCCECRNKEELAKYLSFPLVEWNGSDGLSLFNDPERYFFDIDDIEQYCEDEEIEKKDIQLVLCAPTRFSEINISEIQQEAVHEDWEPDAKLLELEEALNAYLRTASTRTWLPTDQRVVLFEESKEVQNG